VENLEIHRRKRLQNVWIINSKFPWPTLENMLATFSRNFSNFS
jgi:hypothetical protein